MNLTPVSGNVVVVLSKSCSFPRLCWEHVCRPVFLPCWRTLEKHMSSASCVWCSWALVQFSCKFGYVVFPRNEFSVRCDLCCDGDLCCVFNSPSSFHPINLAALISESMVIMRMGACKYWPLMIFGHLKCIFIVSDTICTRIYMQNLT